MPGQLANISIEGVTEKGFVLPNGFTWDVQLKNGMKEGKVIVKNKIRLVHATLFYEHDKLNGICCFYNRGSIIKKITYVDDIAEGWGCECERSEEVRWFFYKNGKKFSKLIRSDENDGYWKEYLIGTESLFSFCQYNTNHQKNGKCYFYYNGSISKIVNYENGIAKDIYKEFTGDEMIEYNNKGDIVYQGEYENSLKKDYPRQGEGVEMQDGECTYTGEWKENKKNGNGNSIVNGYAYYEGEWKNDKPHGYGVLNDSKGIIQYKGNWENGKYKINNKETFDYVTGKIIRSLDLGSSCI